MLTPADLRNDDKYRLLMSVPFDQLGAVIVAYYFRRQTWIIVAHYAFVTVLLIAWLLWGIREHNVWLDWLIHYGWAVGLFFALAAVHEAIHGAMFRMVGAPEVKIKIGWREGTLYAVAPDFVINSRDLGWVLVAPFLVITLVLLAMLFILPAYRYVQLSVILLHTAGCAGDFAILNYLWRHRKQRVLHFDDADGEISNFYEQVN